MIIIFLLSSFLFSAAVSPPLPDSATTYQDSQAGAESLSSYLHCNFDAINSCLTPMQQKVFRSIVDSLTSESTREDLPAIMMFVLSRGDAIKNVGLHPYCATLEKIIAADSWKDTKTHLQEHFESFKWNPNRQIACVSVAGIERINATLDPLVRPDLSVKKEDNTMRALLKNLFEGKFSISINSIAAHGMGMNPLEACSHDTGHFHEFYDTVLCALKDWVVNQIRQSADQSVADDALLSQTLDIAVHRYKDFMRYLSGFLDAHPDDRQIEGMLFYLLREVDGTCAIAAEGFAEPDMSRRLLAWISKLKLNHSYQESDPFNTDPITGAIGMSEEEMLPAFLSMRSTSASWDKRDQFSFTCVKNPEEKLFLVEAVDLNPSEFGYNVPTPTLYAKRRAAWDMYLLLANQKDAEGKWEIPGLSRPDKWKTREETMRNLRILSQEKVPEGLQRLYEAAQRFSVPAASEA